MNIKRIVVHAPRIEAATGEWLKKLAARGPAGGEYRTDKNGMALVRLDCRVCKVTSQVSRVMLDITHSVFCPACGYFYENMVSIPDISVTWGDRSHIPHQSYIN